MTAGTRTRLSVVTRGITERKLIVATSNVTPIRKSSNDTADQSSPKPSARKRAPKVEVVEVEPYLDDISKVTDLGTTIDLAVLAVSKFTDKSSVNGARLSAITDGLDAIRAAAPDWHAAQQRIEGASEAMAKAEMFAREALTLQSGFPDWAGNSVAWVHSWTRPVGEILTANKVNAERRRKFGVATRVWRSENNYTVVHIADYICRNDAAIAKGDCKVDGKMVSNRVLVNMALKGDFDGYVGDGDNRKSKNVAIPVMLRKAIEKHFHAQRDGNGKILDAWVKVPKKFGKGGNKGDDNRKPSAVERTIETHNTYATRLVDAFKSSAADLKGAQGKGELASLFVANELWRITSAALLGVFGTDGTKLDSNAQQRAEVHAVLENVQTLLAAAVDKADDNADWAMVEDLLFPTESK